MFAELAQIPPGQVLPVAPLESTDQQLHALTDLVGTPLQSGSPNGWASID